MGKSLNLQDIFLNQVRKESIPITLFLVNGVQIRGTVQGFDSFTIIVESERRQMMIYKHAISTITPLKKVNFAVNSNEAKNQ
ncbi:RNA chaperone Hfq [Peptococcaceae bacterium]|nr:RNA chaperone Hfq [Peptococcaceae bacterium]MCL0077671.1 RNA chaperone Hfq [Peptococcaceae bacterium]MCL0106114.1 RNA chaperone Hfq [Peptococcaceae bacterium]